MRLGVVLVLTITLLAYIYSATCDHDDVDLTHWEESRAEQQPAHRYDSRRSLRELLDVSMEPQTSSDIVDDNDMDSSWATDLGSRLVYDYIDPDPEGSLDMDWDWSHHYWPEELTSVDSHDALSHHDMYDSNGLSLDDGESLDIGADIEADRFWTRDLDDYHWLHDYTPSPSPPPQADARFNFMCNNGKIITITTGQPQFVCRFPRTRTD
jgi:hypothetical protein